MKPKIAPQNTFEKVARLLDDAESFFLTLAISSKIPVHLRVSAGNLSQRCKEARNDLRKVK